MESVSVEEQLRLTGGEGDVDPDPEELGWEQEWNVLEGYMEQEGEDGGGMTGEDEDNGGWEDGEDEGDGSWEDEDGEEGEDEGDGGNEDGEEGGGQNPGNGQNPPTGGGNRMEEVEVIGYPEDEGDGSGEYEDEDWSEEEDTWGGEEDGDGEDGDYEDEDWYGGSEDGIDINTEPPHADVQLDPTKLPKDNNTDTQVANTCVFKVMELVSEYLGESINSGTIILQYMDQQNMPRTIENIQRVVNSGIDDSHVNDLVFHYFDMTVTADIQNSIDSGYPVMAYMEVSAGIGHEVMITGYYINDDAEYTYQYYDPETGTYEIADESDFKNAISITGLKSTEE